MEKHKLIKLKPLKDKDTVVLSQFLKAFSWALPFLFIIGTIYGYLLGGTRGTIIGILIGSILSVVAAFITILISDKFGETAGFLYRGPKANWSIKEQLEGLLNQVRYHKMNKRFDQALLKVEEVLVKDPNLPEALLLKASVLWEGLNNPIEAKRCLEHILKITLKTDNYHLWASTFYSDIVKEEKKRLDRKLTSISK
jgi:tetratricopeptide (TPR) repeat protein